jgi:hypothetical protein
MNASLFEMPTYMRRQMKDGVVLDRSRWEGIHWRNTWLVYRRQRLQDGRAPSQLRRVPAWLRILNLVSRITDTPLVEIRRKGRTTNRGREARLLYRAALARLSNHCTLSSSQIAWTVGLSSPLYTGPVDDGLLTRVLDEYRNQQRYTLIP